MDRYQPVEQFIHRITNRSRTPAAAIAIATIAQPVRKLTVGESTLNIPATDDTLWPLASISKLYTASAVMSLIEEGRLGVWTKASAVFPEFTGGGREEITLRQLLTHTSRLRLYRTVMSRADGTNGMSGWKRR